MAQRLTVTLDINFLCIVQYSRATQNHSISPSRKEVALNRSKVGEQYPTIIVFWLGPKPSLGSQDRNDAV